MKRISLFSLAFLVQTVCIGGQAFLRKGDVWVMSGDSITHLDGYRQVVAATLEHFHPGSGIRIVNSAVWGQTVAEAAGKGLDLKPTVASIMLGMNNVIHRDYPPTYDFTEDARRYAEEIRRQVKSFQSQGADVVLFTPTLTDETENSYFHVYHTRAGLAAYGQALERIATEERCLLLPIAADFERFKPALGSLETLIPDGVHPYGWGQYALARALIHHLRLEAPLAAKDETRGCDLSEVGLNDLRIVRTKTFLSDGEAPVVSIVAPFDGEAEVKWSAEGSPLRGETHVKLEKGRAVTVPLTGASEAVPMTLGHVARLIVTVVPQADGRPRLTVVDLARTKVFHFKDGVARGEVTADAPRKEGPLVGTWEVRLDGSDLWFSGRMRAQEWPVRQPEQNDLWMNSSGMNGVMALFDFRPLDRFAQVRTDHDVNMVCFSVLEKPWSVMPLAWSNDRVQYCLRSFAEPTADGYEWRIGFRGRVNDYTRFDVSKMDLFGLHFHFVDCEGDRMAYYPLFPQIFSPEGRHRVNPELRLNQMGVFDLRGVVSGDETVTLDVFGL